MMGTKPGLWFGQATRCDEFEQIFRLNHATFTGEIPQHIARTDGRLIDRFHAENEYVICKDRDDVVGMVALRSRRPFSLDEKLPDLDRYLPADRPVCEIRLLAVDPRYRRSRVLPGLVCELVRTCRRRRLEYAVISGTTRQLRLYAHLGFECFGPVVGSNGARFQPMGLSIERFSSKVGWLDPPTRAQLPRRPRTSRLLLPGPVNVHPSVLAAAGSAPESHRSPEFTELVAYCRRRLAQIAGADDVQVLIGSGTLANDAIAQQLRLRGTPGAVLANGEFGERLIDHARRAGLAFTVHCASWGAAFDFDRIAHELRAGDPPRWLWMVHCETSTGVLNDLDTFTRLAAALGAAPVLDCISSLGNVDLNLRDVVLASGVSGKGLAALPGLALVFHRHDGLRTGPLLPRYLDLALYAAHASAPFTHSSNLLVALAAALEHFDPVDFQRRVATSTAVRFALSEAGFRIVGDGASPAPFVVTIALPANSSSREVGHAMLKCGYRIAFESAYLESRNWVQLAWMGSTTREEMLAAVAALAAIGMTARGANSAPPPS